MTTDGLMAKLPFREDLNFLLTNRIPRRWATQFVGWLSKIESPIVRDVSIGIWKLFSGLDVSEAKKTSFESMHDCFVRELKDGARPIAPDPAVMISPCDAIVGACGRIADTELFQVKGFPYHLRDLVPDSDFEDTYRDGLYVTLRLTSSMYHRFHAPYDCSVKHVTYISGDTWNVNPIALKRIEKLFCKNERAVIRTRLTPSGYPVTLVPVAAILVASIRLHCLDVVLGIKHRGANEFVCDANFTKGQEMGWFEHGSTIIVFAPEGFELCDDVGEGAIIRMGRPLMRIPH
ncbi:archaetidylserine decarboxylase [Pseudorhodoplanes sinuspersici]|uniref:phosphatidylserine decarboxylase n=1 Tax=Pseudorhodoplanes sinuspersici TaxID=1235591 RepID=A0A1W6ZK21_9HYPH|nr:archaetidylserine decarboxylase [Pseudorhodoplanes sinuspersici]ARP97763.1 phosphatidylserine decarboxylase [Pseudorhodoplanes sinuspersici]RKE68512.1 phosphatidylserine decarboxylase [Pseudorhodoplanes sinuspersici]